MKIKVKTKEVQLHAASLYPFSLATFNKARLKELYLGKFVIAAYLIFTEVHSITVQSSRPYPWRVEDGYWMLPNAVWEEKTIYKTNYTRVKIKYYAIKRTLLCLRNMGPRKNRRKKCTCRVNG